MQSSGLWVRTVGEVCLPAIPDCILSRCSCGLVFKEYMTYQLLLYDGLNVYEVFSPGRSGVVGVV
jgi:hypothetical protein